VHFADSRPDGAGGVFSMVGSVLKGSHLTAKSPDSQNLASHFAKLMQIFENTARNDTKQR
jgi:hypothetical protein